MKAVLDTGVVIDDVLSITGYELAVTSITYAELEWGITGAQSELDRVLRASRLERIRTRLGTGLPFDDAAATSYGWIASLVKARGANPRSRTADLMIAAVAHANGAAVVTRNVKDFAGLEGLVAVITP
jgi:predicted nucleic acid-binding protein